MLEENAEKLLKEIELLHWRITHQFDREKDVASAITSRKIHQVS